MLYVPKLTINLFSVLAATSKDNIISFKHGSCHIQNKKGKVIGYGLSLGNLYKLYCTVQQFTVTVADMTECTSMIDLWHRWLAHVNHRQLLQQAEISNLYSYRAS